jgi:hypothetical protein
MSPAEFADLFDWCKDDCEDAREWAVANCSTMDDAWATAKPDWLLCIALHPGVLDDRTLRLFAVWSARQVQHLMTDPRSLAAIDAAERHANGQATDEELAAARDAAKGAAGAAARIASSEHVAWVAAREAAWVAYKSAGDAAWEAAWRCHVGASRQAAWLRDNAKPDWERAREMGGAR